MDLIGSSKITSNSSLENGRDKPTIKEGKLERVIHFR